MLAFHKNPELKEQLLNQLQAHYDADEIIKGKYWENGKGCAVGCALHSADHSLGEELYGIPTVLWKLEDRIFEALPNQDAKEFPIQFIKAIPEGADLSKVFYKWSIRMLKRVRPLALGDGKKAIDQVIKFFEEPFRITAADADADAVAVAAVAVADARVTERKKQRDDLLELLRETK